MIITTPRLILRPWKEEDAPVLYKLAKDPDVGPAAGWPAHQDEKESLRIIQTVFSKPENYAICLKENNQPIGAISLLSSRNDHIYPEGECEIGFWIGKPYWGHGYVIEASKALLAHGFEQLGMKTIWCGHYVNNAKSARAQQKIGFVFDHTVDHMPVPLLNEYRDEIINRMTFEDWKKCKEQKDQAD
ncbi:GNAT family N-acetyltransferase [Erysipelotrichaceae bacterium 51-3]